ncbi:SET domain-containing protein [Imleria badia]|nr:SET domain-containing protein [Imleria badia]
MPPPATTQEPTTDRRRPPRRERVSPRALRGVPQPRPRASLSAHARRRRTSTFVPFEAFISPAFGGTRVQNDHSSDKGKGKAREITDPFISPTMARSRVSMGASTSADSHKAKGRAFWHGRRESASAAFEAYIVRDSPKKGSEARTGAGTGVDTGAGTKDAQAIEPLPQPPTQARFLQGSETLSSSTPVIPDAVPAAVPVPVPVPETDEGGTHDTNAMDVTLENTVEVDGQAEDVEGDIGVDSTRVDDGMTLREDEDEDEDESEPEPQEEAEVDEADTLLELASVHLSQPEEVVEDEEDEEEEQEEEPESSVDSADEGEEMDVIDESAGSLEGDSETRVVVDEPEREVGDAMVVDGPPEDLDFRGDDEGETVEITLEDLLSLCDQTEANKPELPAEDVVTTASENNVASTSALAPDGDVIQDDFVEASSFHSMTPDLVLPEDDSISFVHGADSTEECDMLLTAPAECESEPEDALASSPSSKTASSTSLAPPRVRRRSSRSSSRQRSLSRATSSVNQLDLIRRPATVSDQAQGGSSSESRHRYIGGYPVITWASHVAEERERPPEYKAVKDLPHSLQDYMNSFSPEFRNSDVARRIFEAHIEEAMSHEPDAPSIEIFDNAIGDEVTPRWEFHYTNDMWFGEGVPPPDIKHLESCECVGRCDPKGTCPCAQRQRKWVQPYIDGEIIPSTWAGSPFVYDNKGMVQRFECPIFECNKFCHCDDDCPNRVVQNGRKWPVHIVKTMHKGWGVSAGNKKIPKGSYIGIYAGELLTEQEGDTRGRYYDLYGRTYLFSIDFHHLKLGMEDPDEWDNLYVVDAYHAGNFTRFLNHSCDPNCKILACYIDDADINKPLLAVFTTRDVEPWEELCFSYYGDSDEKREEIEAARGTGEEMERKHAVYAQCRCEADNCIGRLFS